MLEKHDHGLADQIGRSMDGGEGEHQLDGHGVIVPPVGLFLDPFDGVIDIDGPGQLLLPTLLQERLKQAAGIFDQGTRLLAAGEEPVDYMTEG